MSTPKDIRCPTCDAPTGPCVDLVGRALPYLHPDRMTAWVMATMRIAATKIAEQAARNAAPTDATVAPSPVMGEDHEATYTLATAGKELKN